MQCSVLAKLIGALVLPTAIIGSQVGWTAQLERNVKAQQEPGHGDAQAKPHKEEMAAMSLRQEGGAFVSVTSDRVCPWFAAEFVVREGRVEIFDVHQGGAAHKSGFMPGDVLLKMDSAELKGAEGIKLILDGMASKQPRSSVSFVVQREQDGANFQQHKAINSGIFGLPRSEALKQLGQPMWVVENLGDDKVAHSTDLSSLSPELTDLLFTMHRAEAEHQQQMEGLRANWTMLSGGPLPPQFLRPQHGVTEYRMNSEKNGSVMTTRFRGTSLSSSKATGGTSSLTTGEASGKPVIVSGAPKQQGLAELEQHRQSLQGAIKMMEAELTSLEAQIQWLQRTKLSEKPKQPL